VAPAGYAAGGVSSFAAAASAYAPAEPAPPSSPPVPVAPAAAPLAPAASLAVPPLPSPVAPPLPAPLAPPVAPLAPAASLAVPTPVPPSAAPLTPPIPPTLPTAPVARPLRRSDLFNPDRLAPAAVPAPAPRRSEAAPAVGAPDPSLAAGTHGLATDAGHLVTDRVYPAGGSHAPTTLTGYAMDVYEAPPPPPEIDVAADAETVNFFVDRDGGEFESF